MARTAFLDEAGISRPADEPFVVTAGFIVNRDTQWKLIEDYLWSMINEHEPPGGYFHAFKLYGRHTPYDEKHGWTEERRFEVLEQLVSIPRVFRCSIVYGYFPRTVMAELQPNLSVREATLGLQVMTASQCIMQVERYTRMVAYNEVADIIIEDTQDMRSRMRESIRFLRHPCDFPTEEIDQEYLPLTHVVGTPHFEEKRDASLLQVADACAFVIKRHLMKSPHIERLFAPIRERLAFGNHHNPGHPFYSKNFRDLTKDA